MSRTPREEEAARGLLMLQEVGAKRPRPQDSESVASKRSALPPVNVQELDFNMIASLDKPFAHRFRLLTSGYAQQIGSFVIPPFDRIRNDLHNPFEPTEGASLYESTQLSLHPPIEKV